MVTVVVDIEEAEDGYGDGEGNCERVAVGEDGKQC